MRIAFVGPHFNSRIGSYELNLFRAMSKLGHHVTMYTTKENQPPSLRASKGEHSSMPNSICNFTVKRFKPLLKPRVSISSFPIAPQIFATLTKDKPDVIHAASHEQPLTLLAFTSAKRLKTPFTYTHWCYHYPPAFHARFGLFAAEHTILFPIWKYTKKIIAGSSVAKEYLMEALKVPEERITVINGGAIDIDLFNASNYRTQDMRAKLGIEERDWVILSIAKLHKPKGLDYLIKALALAKEKKPSANFKLVIVGQGPEKSNLVQLTHEMGLTKDVMILDKEIPYNSMPRIYSVGDVFILPTLSEQVGRVVIEALAMSLPVVATDVGGVREVVKNMVTGILVPMRDEKSLARAIIHLYEDEDLRRKIGKNGRRLVEKSFNYLDMGAETIKVYQEISARYIT